VNDLIIIDRHLGVIDRKLRLLSRLNPVNSRGEKRKFLSSYLAGKKYNPVFRYKKPKINLPRLAERLSALSINIPSDKNEAWFFARHLENKRKRILKKSLALRYRGTDNFTEHTTDLFGRPKQKQINYAKRRLRLEDNSCFDIIKDAISSNEAARAFQKHIDKSLLPWRVKLRRNISSKAGLDSRSKYLLIKADERFAPEEILSLAIHEIETHIFRKENGSLQKLSSLFGGGFAGPPTTEEGLAFFNETQLHPSERGDPRRALIICARTIAAHLAYTKSFYQVFRDLKKRGLPLEYAWAVTLRVKRGMSDTSKPGSFPKDHHYLKGYLEIQNFLNRGGSLRSLYIGSLNTYTVESIAKFGIKTEEPRYLPQYLR
jgi:hypothetical protein